MIDSHCHLDFPVFSLDRPRLMQDARRDGVSAWIVPGVSPEVGPERAAVLALPGVFAATGIHPYAVATVSDLDVALEAVRQRARAESAVAIGECGLDARKRGLQIEGQRELFEGQLRVALELDLPVVVHQVGAQAEFQRSLERVGRLPRGGVIHGFGGELAWAKFLIARGFHLGVGPRLLDGRAERLKGALREVPLERLVLETDAPEQMPPGAIRGEPRDLVLIATGLARLRGVSLDIVAQVTESSTRGLFGLSP